MELKNINAKNKIAVLGNHDFSAIEDKKTSEDPEELIKILKDCGFKVLMDNGELIENVYFAGIRDLYSKRFNLEKAFEKAPKGALKILLSHQPDIIDFVEDSDNIDLILSGHTHAGMIYLKPFGALLPIPNKHPELDRGLKNVGKRTKLFISQGIGYSATRLRIGTDSEIAVIKLEN